jgi:hypothetical protein
VKKKPDILNIHSVLPVLGLVLLLLLSPCKVRNFIQTELGAPQTKVLNKSKSAISQSNCQSFEISESLLKISGETNQQPNSPFSEPYSVGFSINFLGHSLAPGSSGRPQVSDVPLYILYQNIQVYS